MEILRLLFEHPGFVLGALLVAALTGTVGALVNRSFVHRDAAFQASLGAIEKLWIAMLDIDHDSSSAIIDDNSAPSPDRLAAGYQKLEVARRNLLHAKGHLPLDAEKSALHWLDWWDGWLEHVTESHSIYYEELHGNPEDHLDAFVAALPRRARDLIAPQWEARAEQRKKRLKAEKPST